MTTPVVPVFQDYFGGTSWSDEWTQSTASGVPAATFSIVSGKGRITPGLPAFAASVSDKILYAAAWKDSNLKSFSLTATMDKSAYEVTVTSVGWGILFAWDGNINSPTGYMLHSIKGNDGTTTTGLRVSKLTAGTFTELVSIALVNSSEQTVTLRVTPTGVTNLIQFTTTTYGWASVTDSTYMSGGKVAVVSYSDSTTTDPKPNIDDTDWISVKNLTLNRLGSSATGVTPGTGTEGAPYISGSPTSLVQGSSTANATSYTTANMLVPTPSGSGATVTNTGSRLCLAFFSSTYATAGDAANVPTMSGSTLTWTRYNGILHSTARRIDVFQAYGIPTQSAALTFTNTATMTSGLWFVVEIYGAADGSSLTLPTANMPSIVSGQTASSLGGNAATVTLSCGTYLPDVSPHALTIMGVSIPAVATTADQFTAGAFTTELGELVQITPTSHFGLYYAVSPSAPTLTATWLASSNYGAAGVMVQPSVKYPPLDGCTASMGGIG